MKKITLFIILSILFFSCINPEDPTTWPSYTFPDNWEIKYTVTGTTTLADVTYENESGGTSQVSDVAVPWSFTFTGHEDNFVYISAQNGLDSGSITVTIYRDDVIFKTSTSSGAFVIATASGTL